MAITSMHHQQMHQHMSRVATELQHLLEYWHGEDLDGDFLNPEDGTYPFGEDLEEVIYKVSNASMKLYDRAHAETATCKHCQRTITLLEDRWVDTEATGDDSTWSEVCDSDDSFDAHHEPEEA